MPQKKPLPPFDFYTASIEHAKGHVLAFLDPTGPGHTVFCVVHGRVHHKSVPCPTTPIGFVPPVPLGCALRMLGDAGTIQRIGSFLWLRPGRAAATVSSSVQGSSVR